MVLGGPEGDDRERVVPSSTGSFGGFGSEHVSWILTPFRTPGVISSTDREPCDKMTAMSIEPESKEPIDPCVSRESLDLSGLPAPVADELQKLVAALRDNLVHAPSFPTATGDSPEAWARRLQAWVDTHPARPISIDDSRESLYSGRGEFMSSSIRTS
jgi:hypothetical protein